MGFGRSAVALCAAVSLQTGVAGAQGRSLTLSEVLARAREQAPDVVTARLAIEEARGRLVGASLRRQVNPELDTAIGNRQGGGERSTDVDIGLSQAFEPGSRRRARIAGAEAAIAQSTAELDETIRLALRAAGAAYVRALHATARMRLLDVSQELAAGVYSVADRRYRAGDIAVLDVNLARASLARARAEREAADASRVLALGELQQLLRLDGDVTVMGELATPASVNLFELLQSASDRPELRILEAAIREAEADVQLGRTFSRPDYGVGVRYEREEGDQSLLGGLTLTLPVFATGQELRAVGTARAARLRTALDLARSRVQLEVQSAHAAYARRLAALRVLQDEGVPGLEESEQLTARSFEVGQLGLPELLVIRREILETRVQFLDALLEAALARIDLEASAAVLR